MSVARAWSVQVETSEKMWKFSTIYTYNKRYRVEAANSVVHAFCHFLSSDVWTAVTFGCSTFLAAFSGVFQLRGMLQNTMSLVLDDLGHITPVWRQLHWLPVRQRIEFKLAVLVYKSLNGVRRIWRMTVMQLITTEPCHYHRPPATSIVQRRYVRGAKKLYCKFGRSIIHR